MTKQSIQLFDLWSETINALTRDGLLLNSIGADGKPNVMTIGWMTGGVIWSKPILIVLVRPSRYTFSLLEQIGEFTVNVLPPELAGVGAGAEGPRARHRGSAGELRMPGRSPQRHEPGESAA